MHLINGHVDVTKVASPKGYKGSTPPRGFRLSGR
jgi:hypothetical protein